MEGYYKITGSEEFVSEAEFEGATILKVAPEALETMACTAFRDVQFMLRPAHNAQVSAILDDPDASANDRFVARALLRNACIALEGRLPLCQDTGTAIIYGWKGQNVWTGGGDAAALTEGVRRAFTCNNFRYSQNIPDSVYEEHNSGNNLPAQIEIEACDGNRYRFLCVAKGGGSANKTQLFQETKAILKPETLAPFLTEKIKALGTSACPPYHIAICIGGTSAEANLRTVKLASCRHYDSNPLPEGGLRDIGLEARLLEECRKSGIGAQFGGRHLAHDIRVVRLPRHGASCPIGIGVSCSADRNVNCAIDSEGIWIEQLDNAPMSHLLRGSLVCDGDSDAVGIDLDRPMPDILAQLSSCAQGTRLSLSGTVIVARDIAHARIAEQIHNGGGMPEWFKNHPVMYAGPAKTPEGMACGSMGPTTAGRMDIYVDEFQALGGSLVMIAKGNRSSAVADACKRHGGYYLGTIGGAAALLAKEHIRSIDCIAYPELGMEAVWKIRVEDFPAFVLIRP